MTRTEIIEKAKEVKNFMDFKNYAEFYGHSLTYGKIKANNINEELPVYESGDVVEIDGKEVCILGKSAIGIGYTYVIL